MSRGYVLVVSKNKKNANFFMTTKGYEMCPFNVAKQLIKDGIVVEDGEHHLGTRYKLAEDVAVAPPEPRRRAARPAAPPAEPEPEPVIADIPDEDEDEVVDDEEAEDEEGDEAEDDPADDTEEDEES